LFDDFFGRVVLKPITLRSNTLEAIIAPTPTPPATLPLLGMAAPPVGRTEIYTSYDSSEIKFGETKTVEVTISSTGLINSLKGPLFKSSPSLKIYEESPQTTNEFDGSRLISKRTFKISLLPMSGDKVEIEPLRLGFFDPELGTFSVAEGEPIRFLVSGAPKISTSEPTQTGIEVEAEQPPPPSQQRSDELKYQEPTIIERLSERVSATLVAWFVFALISAAGATLLGLRLRSHLIKRKALFSHLEAADTPSKLSLVIRGAIRARYPGLTVEFSRAELRALVSDPNMLYQLERVLDGFDEALYGGSHRDLRELKELSRRCLELLN
jgi:hypothetical protein